MPRIYRIYHVESRSDPTFTDKRDKMKIDSEFLLFLDINHRVFCNHLLIFIEYASQARQLS